MPNGRGRFAQFAFILSLAVFISELGSAQSSYQPSPENLQARREFQDMKFGMFIHWGVYSVLGDGEWVFHNRKLKVDEYNRLPMFFDPEKFDAHAWVSLAKSAGMKYITITSRHHDGFAMFDSKISDWNIVQRTPYKKDPLKMLADECHRQGIKLFFYYSQLDWHNADYYPRGVTSWDNGRPDHGDWDAYLDHYMDGQLTELLTNYGPVGGIWFDGMWDKPNADWRLRRTYDLIHKLQPAALVGNNHHLPPFEGEDFQMFEKDLPGQNTTGFSGDSKIGNLPLETCDTISGAWGYNSEDTKYKSPKQLVAYLARAAGNNANFLLNIGPKPDGTVQPEFVSRLHDIGGWTSKYGESIYGTRGGPLTPRPWGVTTAKGSKIYVHILDWPDEALLLPKLPKPVSRATLMATGQPVTMKEVDGNLLLKVPLDRRDPWNTVVVLETNSTSGS